MGYIITMKTNVTLEVNDNATRRTRNRIREHGPNFRAERSGMCGSIDELGWLVRAEDGWFGWLPRSEFNFKKVNG